MTSQPGEYLLQMHKKGKISDIALDKALSALNAPEENPLKMEST